MEKIFAVILAGGSGTRFWPESRSLRPKQLLPITGKKPMIVETVERLQPLIPHNRVFIVTHQSQVAAVRKLLPKIPAKNILAEPVAKNTAASIGWAASSIESQNPQAILAVLPADHSIETKSAFQKDLQLAAQSAKKGGLVTFGIRPSFASTGYGYLERGQTLEQIRGRKIYRVKRFAEKPNAQTAKRFVQSKNFLWNSGMFIWRKDEILAAIKRFLPKLHTELQKIQRASSKKNFSNELKRSYGRLDSISIDYGVMEKASEVKMLEAAFRWSDVGSWSTLAMLMKKPRVSNIALFPSGGLFLQKDSKDCLIFSEEPHLIAGIGLENLVIVRTHDATLVCKKERAEEVKALVEELQRQKRNEWL